MSLFSKRKRALEDDDVLKVCDNPRLADKLSDEQLDECMLTVLMMQGGVGPQLPSFMSEIHSKYRARINANKRMFMQQAVRTLIEQGQTEAFALLPVIVFEEEENLVATAAIDYASLRAPYGGEPLTAVHELLSVIDMPQAGSSEGIFAGLLQLGDRRVCDLLGGVKHQLDRHQVKTLSRIFTGSIWAAVVDFYLDWLDELVGDTDDGKFGSVCAALHRMPREAREPVVRESVRQFPVTPGQPSGNWKQVWTLSEYAELIRPRLQAVAEREEEPRIVPVVLESWGLG